MKALDFLGKTARARIAHGLAVVSFFLPVTGRASGRKTGGNAEPGTHYSERVKELNAEFHRDAPDVNMIVMDRDWFQLNLARRQISDADDAGRQKLIAEYVKDRIGIDVAPERFTGGMTDAITNYGEMTWPAQPGNLFNKVQPYVCISFGEAADDTLDAQAHSEIGLDPDNVGSIAKQPVRRYLSLATENAWSDYHEISHCLDPGMRQSREGMTPLQSAMITHHGEMYADVLAALLLARDGITDFAPMAADIRLAGSALKGPFAARIPARKEEHFLAFAYTIHDGLWAVQRQIDSLGVDKIRKMPLAELRAIAEKITDENMLDDRKAIAIIMMQKDLYSLKGVDRLRRRDHSYEAAYEYCVKLKTDMDKALRNIVDVSNLDPKRPVLDQIRFDFKSHSDDGASAEDGKVIAHMLANRLLDEAGKDNATEDSLTAAFRRAKDKLRDDLSSPDEMQRATAARCLPLMEDAIYEAMHKTIAKGPKP